MLKVLPLESGHFADPCNQDIEHSADWGVIIESYERVHLHPLVAEHDLNHDEAHGFKADASELKDESDNGELNFPGAGHGDTKHND